METEILIFESLIKSLELIKADVEYNLEGNDKYALLQNKEDLLNLKASFDNQYVKLVKYKGINAEEKFKAKKLSEVAEEVLACRGAEEVLVLPSAEEVLACRGAEEVLACRVAEEVLACRGAEEVLACRVQRNSKEQKLKKLKLKKQKLKKLKGTEAQEAQKAQALEAEAQEAQGNRSSRSSKSSSSRSRSSRSSREQKLKKLKGTEAQEALKAQAQEAEAQEAQGNRSSREQKLKKLKKLELKKLKGTEAQGNRSSRGPLRRREAIRGVFTEVVNDMNTELRDPLIDKSDIYAKFDRLEALYLELVVLNERCQAILLAKAEATDDEIDKEFEDCEVYITERYYLKARIRVMREQDRDAQAKTSQIPPGASSASSNSDTDNQKVIKLQNTSTSLSKSPEESMKNEIEDVEKEDSVKTARATDVKPTLAKARMLKEACSAPSIIDIEYEGKKGAVNAIKEKDSEAELKDGVNESEAKPKGEGVKESEVNPKGDGVKDFEDEPKGDGVKDSKDEPKGDGVKDSEDEPKGDGVNDPEARPTGDTESKIKNKGDLQKLRGNPGEANLKDKEDSEAKPKGDGVKDSETVIKGYKPVSNSRAVAEGTDSKVEEEKLNVEQGKIIDTKDWLNDGFIEGVDEIPPEGKGYWFPDRPVFRCESETTPIRPVCDGASCRGHGARALRRYLKRRPILLRRIPEIGIKLRKNKYGVLADVRRYFQVMAIRENDWDYLRFLWKKKMDAYGATSGDVTLPTLGESRINALKRFLSLERKLQKSPSILKQYCDFMDEYLLINHMELIPSDELDTPSGQCYYIPHHCVFQEQSTTTKLRVVFDASCKTSNGKSLNDFLLVGPKLQQDIFNILIRFRTRPIAFSGDIEKMYRQVRIDSRDCDFQIILWRKNPSEPLFDYRLLTVTYGLSCAPYLAMRTLHQLARDKVSTFPTQLKKLHVIFVKSIIFFLRDFESDSCVKILGICWNPSLDIFQILVDDIPEQTNSKIHLLSHISRIFDPIGWLSPVIIRLKILLQSLWKQKLNWDDPLPDTLCSQWKKIGKELSVLNKIQIPRYFSCRGALLSVELHGFCDSSEVAYAAVFYIRSHLKSGQVKVSLIASKTRVAPLKMISIPRLELCAALLLATLYDTIRNYLCLQIDRVFLWTDFKIVLSWIKSESRHWKPFVGNGIAEVQRLTLHSSWHYVISKDNPADCASRGITPSELVDHSLWWRGPTWLSDVNFEDPIQTQYDFPKEISGRSLVKKIIHQCMVCFRAKRQVTKQIMGDLPMHRIVKSNPFNKTGIDFAGPFLMKANIKRSKVKSYVALFVCFCTKAIHIEIVSDLSSAAFLAALKRFISRRGKPSDIFSDNGTNFRGANNILREQFDILKSSTIQKFISNERINWHFIPPSAPNFGGIWEAGIKSFKFHLLRCLKSQILTYEELSTMTTQIEACLNSRPICPPSSDSDDFNPLTPGHFLIGRPLTALPESNDDDVPINYLDRWSLNKKIKNVFWKRWNREYLNNLQQRLKWQKSSPNIKEGDLILLKDTISPPAMYWSLGRITKVFPGADGKVRVVEVKTKHQEHLTRTVSKIVPLPFAED
ncbi:hypothetical protein LAZ67_10001650 [Cordylochernes scorpioides]|uniref:Integrase catalytic domain-containing protein n=1 Tax=Cordylochernes scorpioides TaxID=51811 RepID=A0ABY6KW06_9ARAC|nr:hypothetical protein LAZ67_10001650 [Cordylochernes scorpioides]